MSRQSMMVALLTMTTALSLTPATGQTNRHHRPSPTTSSQKITQTERHFLTEAIQSDLAEASIGKLAQEKGHADEVKEFGQMLQQDHGDHLKRAEQIAKQMGITAPNSPSARQQATQEKLAKLSGPNFDKEFNLAMVRDHQEDVAKYRREAQGKGLLAQFAQQTVPILEKHLKHAQALGKPTATTGKGTKREH